MRTDELIEALSKELKPVEPNSLRNVLLWPLLAGIVASIMLMALVLGLRHDLRDSLASPGMWLKLAYSLALAVIGLSIVERSARPGADTARYWALILVPCLGMALASVVQLSAPHSDMQALVLGHSSRVCAVLVTLTALPILVASFLALRRLAPTRLTLAGAAAGFFAGAAGAFIYAFHCTEAAAPFIAIWYTLGVVLTTLIGAISGQTLLRW